MWPPPKFRKAVFLLSEVSRAWLPTARGYKVLFSASEWEAQLRLYVGYTPHHYTFADLRTADLDAYDLVVPLNVSDVLWLADRAPHRPPQLIPSPTRESVELCDNKTDFNQFLIDHGYSRLIPRMGPGLSPPFICKKRVDDYARNCHLILSPEDEHRFRREIESDEYLTQQMVAGKKEYATHVCVKGGRIVASLMVEYGFDHDLPIKGQSPSRYKALGHCPHLPLWEEVLNLIGFEGLCCVNYKVEGGRPMLLEINPRFGSSLAPFFFSFFRHLGRQEHARQGPRSAARARDAAVTPESSNRRS